VSSTAAPRPSARRDLQHILGTGFGIAVGLGAMIGSGILRTPALIAADVPSASLIAGLWIAGGLHAALGANILAELATALPRTGGQYVYARRALGDSVGLLVAGSSWLIRIAAIAAASVSFAEFLCLLAPAASSYKSAVAILLQTLLYGANIVGLREGRAVQGATSLMKAIMLLMFAGAVILIMPAQHSLAAHDTAPAIGAMGLVAAYPMVIGAYSGWMSPAVFSEESADPSRSVPRSLGLALLATVLLYVSVNLALLHALGTYGLAGSPLPFAKVLLAIGGLMAATLFAIGAMVTVMSCANAAIMTSSRMLFALSRDGLAPASLLRINGGGSPTAALTIGALVSMTLAASGSFATIFGLIGILNIIVDLLVTGAFFVLRRREPFLPRPFHAWGYPWVPAIPLVVNTVLLVLFARTDLTGVLLALGMAALCVPFAFAARRTRSRLGPPPSAS
jgi:APA family basic amino acid/polyamine antiporter